MHKNNLVYKGYRLNAKVVRGIAEDAGHAPAKPLFTATVFVMQVDAVQDQGYEYPVPMFARGEFASSPREGVHVAITYGLSIVDALMGVTS